MIKNLKQLRHERGITQNKLASVLGVSQQSVNKYENHNVEPDLSTIMKMADYFGTTVDMLIGHTVPKDSDTALCVANDDEAATLRAYRTLTEEQKAIVRAIVESYH